MPENKTQRTKASAAFLSAIADAQQRKDAKAIAKMMAEISGEKAAMWGPAIIGFGQYRYKYASGREGDWPKLGFAPRKANLTLYIMPGFKDYEALLQKLGKHKTGKSCLYIGKLADVDEKILRALIARSWAWMNEKYG